MMKFFWLVLGFSTSPFMIFSQQVNNVRFEQVGKKIHVFYDLMGSENYNIVMEMSQDEGVTWEDTLKNVTGDVGENQQVGMNKKIVWDALTEAGQLTGNISFRITASKFTEGSFVDNRDGQSYTWKIIGKQIWMTENLNYKTGNSYCYDDKLPNCELYGRLYDWFTAQNSCPSGWHLPSDDEWKTMEIVLGMSQSDIDDIGLRGTDQGNKMKSTSGWLDNGNGTNRSGFNALPGGNRFSSGVFLDNLGYQGFWWSATEYSRVSAYYRYLHYNNSKAYRSHYSKTSFYSVRCIKDN